MGSDDPPTEPHRRSLWIDAFWGGFPEVEVVGPAWWHLGLFRKLRTTLHISVSKSLRLAAGAYNKLQRGTILKFQVARQGNEKPCRRLLGVKQLVV